MTRDRLVRAALRAWPPAVRARRGPEIADTLLEASDSRARFARELAALAWRGLGARVAAPGPSAALLDGARLAGGLFIVVLLAAYVHAARVAGAPAFVGQMALLAASCALAIAGRDRWAGAGLLGVTLWRLAATPLLGPEEVLSVFPVACALAMLGAPRPPRPRRAVLLAGALLLPLAALHRAGPLEEGAAIFGLASLLTLAGDPRPAIACAVVALSIGTTMAALGGDQKIAVILLALAPLTLLAATARSRVDARAGPTSPGRRR